jgi:hypothetical protein
MQGVERFGIKAKLAPHYIGHFPNLARLGAVAYRLELPPSLVGVHNLFHVSHLKKYLKVPTDVIVDDVAPLDVDLSYPDVTPSFKAKSESIPLCVIGSCFTHKETK